MRVVILTEVKKKKYLKEILLLKKFLQSQNYLSSSTLQILYLKEATEVVTRCSYNNALIKIQILNLTIIISKMRSYSSYSFKMYNPYFWYKPNREKALKFIKLISSHCFLSQAVFCVTLLCTILCCSSVRIISHFYA